MRIILPFVFIVWCINSRYASELFQHLSVYIGVNNQIDMFLAIKKLIEVNSAWTTIKTGHEYNKLKLELILHK